MGAGTSALVLTYQFQVLDGIRHRVAKIQDRPTDQNWMWPAVVIAMDMGHLLFSGIPRVCDCKYFIQDANIGNQL